MNAILSCKLFRCSDHQDRILTALSDPINQELVVQLNKYLSDSDNDVADPEVNVPATTPDIYKKSSDSKPDRSESDRRDATPPDPHRLSKMLEEVPKEDLSPGSDPNGNTSKSEDVADTADAVDSVDGVTSIESTVDNSSADITDGVSDCIQSGQHSNDIRSVRFKDSEIWVYCKDTVNLNHIMDDIIDDVRRVYGDQLEFSRLARTENAIVFTREV